MRFYRLLPIGVTEILNVDTNVSSRINLMRILLIAGIVFVHIPFDPQTSPYLGTYGALDWIRVYLGDSLFRIGVPCLSAISGYLLFRKGLAVFDYGKVMRTKAETILLPFLLWNGGFLLIVFLAQKAGLGHGYVPDVTDTTPREWATQALALEAWPINLPLYFLRDLLLCLLLSPVIGFMVMRYPRATLLVFLAYAVLPVPGGIFLKKSILLGFSIGVYASLHKVDVKRLDPHALQIVLAVGLSSLLLAIGLFVTGPEFPFWIDSLRELTAVSGIIGAWTLSSLLVQTRPGKAMGKGSGLSFWIFCAHYPLLIALWILWNRAGFESYPLFYVTAPLLVIAVLVATHSLVKKTAPGLLGLLTGNRIGTSRHNLPAVANRASPNEVSSHQRYRR